MAIQLHLIDRRSPRGFTFIPRARQATYPILRIPRSGQQPDDWFSLVGPEDTMVVVVSNILSQYGRPPGRLDVIRFEAHGIAPFVGAPVDRIDFASAMDATSVGAFSQIVALWSRPYRPGVASATAYTSIVPRIEMHGCEPVHGCDAMLQALANAAQAMVFASSASQTVSGHWRDMFAIEPPVFRFDPGGSQPVQLP